jgi:predicted phosphoribosyltransferase
LFNDREDAGKQLAEALRKYKEKKPLVLAIPRGGVEVGVQVARFLEAEFSIIVARKLPYPDTPESGFGAIAEDGSLYLQSDARYWLPEVAIQAIIQEQTEEMNRRISILRQGKPLPKIFNKTIILVDDGIAMGSTMHASVMLCKNKKAKSIIVAAPVAGERVAMELEQSVDDVMILEKPLPFHAVVQVYRYWHDVSDKEVLNLLKNYQITSKGSVS